MLQALQCTLVILLCLMADSFILLSKIGQIFALDIGIFG
jgi:hypothetical protein